MEKNPAVYIMTNATNKVLYTGVTSNLVQRVYQHKSDLVEGCFTSKYKCKKLVYFEQYSEMVEAISREKQIKSYRRQKKLDLINLQNNSWRDLYDTICF